MVRVYEPIDANHPILLADAGLGTDFYGSTKVAAEAMLFAYHQALGLDFPHDPAVGGPRLGMNQYVGPIKAMVENAVRGEPAHFEFGGAHPRAGMTHARDIVGLVVAMLDAPDDADRTSTAPMGGAMVTTTEVAAIGASSSPAPTSRSARSSPRQRSRWSPCGRCFRSTCNLGPTSQEYAFDPYWIAQYGEH